MILYPSMKFSYYITNKNDVLLFHRDRKNLEEIKRKNKTKAIKSLAYLERNKHI